MNEINGARLLSELQRAAAQARSEPVKGPASGNDFSALFKQAVEKVNDLQQTSERMAGAFESGDPQANLVETMVAIQKAGVAFQTMLQVRNKLVNAYQEIMSMPI